MSPPAGLSLGWRLTFWICSVHVNAGARFLPWACSLGGRSRWQSDQTRHTGAQVLPPRASARSRVATLAWPGRTSRPRLGPPWLRAWSGGSSPCGWRQLISGSFLFLFLFYHFGGLRVLPRKRRKAFLPSQKCLGHGHPVTAPRPRRPRERPCRSLRGAVPIALPRSVLRVVTVALAFGRLSVFPGGDVVFERSWSFSNGLTFTESLQSSARRIPASRAGLPSP